MFFVAQIWGEGGGTLVGADAGLPVGPFDRESALEALDFHLLQGVVRFGEVLLGSDFCDCALEFDGVAVDERVIANDLPDGDAVTGEKLLGPLEDHSRGRAILVAVDPGAGQAGVVVSHPGGGRIKAKPQVLVVVAAARTVNKLAVSVRDLAESLHVIVD